MRLLVDYDDVLFHLYEPWVYAVNAKYGTDVLPSQIRGWDIEKYFPRLTKDQVFSVLYDESFWRQLKPKRGAVQVLNRLTWEGYSIKIVTSSFYETISWKIEHMLNKFPFLRWDDVVVTQEKQCIIGDVLIDDAPHNLLGGAYKKILFTTDPNANFCCEKNNIFRAKNWLEVYTLIQCLAHYTKRG
jgi:5'(3')-deoxyribonucleotidase